MVALFALMAALLPLSAFAQGTIVPFIPQAFYDSSGNPLNGGKLCTYVSGTTTPQSTYSDVTLTTPNANPVILSANGRPTTGAIYLSPTSYKFVLLSAGSDATCSTGTTQWSLDNISAVPTASGNVDVTGTAGEALSLGDVAYLSDGSGGATAGRWYKADADFTYASSQAGVIGLAAAAIGSGSSGSIRLGGRMTGLSSLTSGTAYYVSATAGALTGTAPANLRRVGAADSTTTLVFDANPAPPASTNLQNCGRLTLETGVPASFTDQAAKTSVYFTPDGCNQLALYDGTANWNVRTFNEITISITTCTASKPYDVFMYDNAGVVTAETLVWTNDTTRATALVRQNGVWVKTGATTRRFVGSYYCNSSGGQTDDTFAKRNVCNADNRIDRPFKVFEATSTWTYSTNTYRQARATATNQVETMACLQEFPVRVRVAAHSSNDSGTVNMYTAIGEDSTTTASSNALVGSHYIADTAQPGDIIEMYSELEVVAIGRHTYVWLEKASGTTTTWYGTSGGIQSGMTGSVWQ